MRCGCARVGAAASSFLSLAFRASHWASLYGSGGRWTQGGKNRGAPLEGGVGSAARGKLNQFREVKQASSNPLISLQS